MWRQDMSVLDEVNGMKGYSEKKGMYQWMKMMILKRLRKGRKMRMIWQSKMEQLLYRTHPLDNLHHTDLTVRFLLYLHILNVLYWQYQEEKTTTDTYGDWIQERR